MAVWRWRVTPLSVKTEDVAGTTWLAFSLFFPDFGKRSIVFILGLPHQGPTRGRILGHDLPDFINISTACQIIVMEKGTNLIFDLEARFCQLRQCEAYHQGSYEKHDGRQYVFSFSWEKTLSFHFTGSYHTVKSGGRKLFLMHDGPYLISIKRKGPPKRCPFDIWIYGLSFLRCGLFDGRVPNGKGSSFSS